MVKVYNSGNSLETEQIIQTLKERGIPAMKKDAGAGGYMAISTGMSLSGADIYVEEEKADEARDIIALITDVSDEEPEENLSRLNTTRRIMAVVLLLFCLIGIAATIWGSM